MTLQKDPERTETKTLHKFADFSNKRVLEIGCGDGRLTWQYAKRARFAAGIDLEADDLRVATIDRPSDLPVSFVRADSIHIPFPKEKFDIAILAWSL
ncbi:MAG: class I SAM-dependent methyltransferase [Chloroflexi bacterium]|nr:class I SAM-dependent methyltransferase [Chloroflexota bacterium]